MHDDFNYSRHHRHLSGYWKDILDCIFGCLGVIVLTILRILISPAVVFCTGLAIGWIIKVTFGDMMIQGLELLNLNIAKESLPLLCGTLGVIGNFFKSKDRNTKVKTTVKSE